MATSSHDTAPAVMVEKSDVSVYSHQMERDSMTLKLSLKTLETMKSMSKGSQDAVQEVCNSAPNSCSSDSSKTIFSLFTVYGSCRVTRGRRKFTVRHRRRVTDPCACRVCTCLYGRLYCRMQRNCSRCDTSKTCTLPNNSTIGHGESARVDCNKLEIFELYYY